MIREEGLEQITDGRTYGSNDMVKIGTLGCKGCSECCRVTGDTIKLDPYDLYNLTAATGKSFDTLLAEQLIELQVADGLILPNLAVQEQTGCRFLSSEGRCTIHSARPGFCRLFPLGRLWETEDSFRYILQIHECGHCVTKMKIRKWLEIPDLSAYEQFNCRWHVWLKDVQHVLEGVSSDTLRTRICTYLLETFYRESWDTQKSFYEQFDERLGKARCELGLAPVR